MDSETWHVNAALAAALDNPLFLAQFYVWIRASHFFCFYQNIFVVVIHIVAQKVGVF